jgi:SMC interacting uncharacterized protein involved in chromosome segregation
MTQNPNLFLSIGKQVKDEYGRTVGRVTSLAVNPNGRVDSIYMEQGDGRFIKCPTKNLKIEDAEITLLSKLKMGITTLCDQIPLIWRKDQALKELVDKKKISPEVYEDLHNSFEGVLNQLKSEAQTLIDEIDEETARCFQEIKELNYALVNLEIEHEIGKIDEQPYQTAFTMIQECLKRVNMERSDLEATKNNLSNILLGETPPQIEQETKEEPTEELKAQEEVPTPPSQSLPEPPVVVYVKEVGESGI